MRIGALLSAWGRTRRGDARLSPHGTSQHAVKAFHLSSIDVFRDLPRSEVERLAEATRMITCPRGKVVYRPGEPNEALFLLKTGRIQIVRQSADGKRLISAVLGPHTFFGEMALVGQRFPQDSTAEAVEDALICVLSRTDLERLILQHPKVGLRFLERVSARLLETEAVVEDFAFKTVPARLAGTLLRLAETGPNQLVNASHQELADMTALTAKPSPWLSTDFKRAEWSAWAVAPFESSTSVHSRSLRVDDIMYVPPLERLRRLDGSGQVQSQAPGGPSDAKMGRDRVPARNAQQFPGLGFHGSEPCGKGGTEALGAESEDAQGRQPHRST